MSNDNNNDKENIEQENIKSHKVLNLKKVFKLLAVIVLIIILIFKYNKEHVEYGKVIFENENIKIEYGPKRTINDYSFLIKLENGDTLLVGGHTYIDGSVSGGKNAELYSLKENQFYKLPKTVYDFSALKKTAIANNKILLDSGVKNEIEIYDVKNKNFLLPDKETLTDGFNKNNIHLMDENKITINGIPYIIQNLNEQYDLLISDDDSRDCKLYNKQNNNIIRIPKLKYTPFVYSNENLIKIDNRKFLIPLNYEEYTCLPTYNTLIITIKG